jgi:hypothetical protein
MVFGLQNQEDVALEVEQPAAPVEMTRFERLDALQQAFAGLMTEAGRLADAIRDRGVVAMPAIIDTPVPEAGPLQLKGFVDHFAYLVGGRICHAVLALRDAAKASGVDMRPQVGLQELTGRILELNQYCQQAELDDALGVALQSPQLPGLVDEILVGLATYAAFAENLVRSLPISERPAQPADEAFSGRDAAAGQRYRRMAADKMLDPARIPLQLDMSAQPFEGVITQVAPHDGDYFINFVYFPAGLARSLLPSDPLDPREKLAS